MQVKLEHVLVLFDSVRRHTSSFNFELQPAKCGVHVPKFAGTPMEDWPAELSYFASIVPVSRGGLTLLGTEAAGELAMPLYTDSAAASEATARRADKAKRLASAVIAMIMAAPPAGALQAAWAINRCIIAHSLTYDSRVLPCRLVLPHAEAVDEAVKSVISAVLASPPADLDGRLMQQIVLPVQKAGLQIDLPSRVLPMCS